MERRNKETYFHQTGGDKQKRIYNKFLLVMKKIKIQLDNSRYFYDWIFSYVYNTSQRKIG